MSATCFAPRASAVHTSRAGRHRQPSRAPAAHDAHRQQLCAQPLAEPAGRASVCCRAEPADSLDAQQAPLPAESDAAATTPLEPRDDDVLPDSLTDAIAQASDSTVTAMAAGSSRIVAEVLLGEFWDPASGAIFAEEGDQQRFWKLTRRFAENLANSSGKRVRALYPDMGVAAMLKNQWADPGFSIGSLGDRTPYQEEDDIIVFAAPDPQGVTALRRITSDAVEKTIVMFNPRLSSTEVGVGLNVRRMVLDFLGSFTTAYSLRPIGDIGTVFRRYPEPWKVFIEDADLQGRYKLIAERDSRPGGEGLDIIIQDALLAEQRGGGAVGENGEAAEPGILTQVGRTITSVRRFMNSLTR